MPTGIKTSRILLTSAARTASTATLLQTDMEAAALRLYLSMTAVPGGTGVVVVIRGYDKVSGGSVELTTGGDPVTQPGVYAYEMSFAPDPAFGNVREAASRSVPYQWDAQVKHLDGLSYTYSLSAEIIK